MDKSSVLAFNCGAGMLRFGVTGLSFGALMDKSGVLALDFGTVTLSFGVAGDGSGPVR